MSKQAPEITQEKQRRLQESERVEQARAKLNEPHEIRNGSIMKRQAKNMHRQDRK